MLVSSYVNGFGGCGQATPSLAALLQAATARQQRQGFGRYGLGADLTNFAQFLAAGTTATYHNAANDPVPGTPSTIVFCSKDTGNRPQCQLMSATVSSGKARTGPVADMQRAIDRIQNAVVTNRLAGREMVGPVPTGDGTTTSETKFTIPNNGQNPILTRSGYDGVLGASTFGFGKESLTLAGMLKQVPNNVALAFVSPGREDIFTMFSGEIATYLNDVANNFDQLLAAFNNRGNVPASTVLDLATIPAIVPLVGEKRNIAPIIGAAAAMLGLTAIAAVSAAKKKPDIAYADDDFVRPALGRRRGMGRRPRSW